MKNFLVVAFIFILNISLDAQWVNRFNGTGNSNDMAYSTVVDASGNIIVAGKSIGVGTGYDYVIIKYSSSGDQQWVQRFNSSGSSNDYPFSLATDLTGNVYVTGNSNGTTTIKYNTSGIQQWIINNNTFIANSMATDQNGNVYVTGTNGYMLTIKYNSSGVQKWVKTSLPGVSKSVITDASGNVYVTGGGGNGTDNVTIKYDSLGVQHWLQNFGTTFSDMSHSIAVDLSGNVYSSGRTWAAFGSWYNTVKYNSSGVQQWNQSYNYVTPYGFSSDWANSVAVDGSGNVYTAGGTWNGTSRDFVLIKYNAFGSQQWIQTYNGPGNDFDMVNAIGIDGSGNIYVTGMSKGIGTAEDFATIKYNSFGAVQWIERYNGPGSGEDKTTSISVSSGGNVVVTGRSWNGTNFDFATIKYSQQTQPIPQPSISISPIQINPGGSVSITGQNFRANAQVKVSVTSSNSENVLDQTIPTNSNGGFSTSYSSNENSSPGIYSISCRDIVTNQSAPNKVFEINEPEEIFNMVFVSPSLDSVGNIVNIEWRDKMVTGSYYSIDDTNKRFYKYLINYSTDNGVTWQDSILVEGKSYINQISSFRKTINIPSLVNSNSSSTNVKFKITDEFNNSRTCSSSLIPIKNKVLLKSSLSMVWDFYSKSNSNSPIGVCADGVSRVYLRVSKNLTSPSINNVTIA